MFLILVVHKNHKVFYNGNFQIYGSPGFLSISGLEMSLSCTLKGVTGPLPNVEWETMERLQHYQMDQNWRYSRPKEQGNTTLHLLRKKRARIGQQ